MILRDGQLIQLQQQQKSNSNKNAKDDSIASTNSTNGNTNSPSIIPKDEEIKQEKATAKQSLNDTVNISATVESHTLNNRDNPADIDSKYSEAKTYEEDKKDHNIGNNRTDNTINSNNNSNTTGTTTDNSGSTSPSSPRSPLDLSSSAGLENEGKEHGDEKISNKNEENNGKKNEIEKTSSTHNVKNNDKITSETINSTNQSVTSPSPSTTNVPLSLSSLLSRRYLLPSLELILHTNPNNYEYKTIIPSWIPRDKLQIDYDSGLLSLKAEFKKEELDTNGNIIAFSNRQIHSAVNLPSDTDPDSITAKFDHNNNTLTIKVNRITQNNTPQRILIQ